MGLLAILLRTDICRHLVTCHCADDIGLPMIAQHQKGWKQIREERQNLLNVQTCEITKSCTR